LTVSFTYDLHPNKGEIEREVEKIIIGDYNQIIKPFLTAIKKFSSQTYEQEHWPFNLDQNKIGKLLADT